MDPGVAHDKHSTTVASKMHEGPPNEATLYAARWRIAGSSRAVWRTTSSKSFWSSLSMSVSAVAELGHVLIEDHALVRRQHGAEIGTLTLSEIALASNESGVAALSLLTSNAKRVAE